MISVIIPVYNSERWVTATLGSVRAQQCADMEVIAVDDGSTDSSAELVKRDFPEVRLVRTTNHGASHARNLGTSLARGEFIQYLDADDLLVEGKIQLQLETLERTGADVAYGAWQKLESSSGGFVPGEIIDRTIEGDPEIALFTDFWCPPAVYLFRRAIVDRVCWEEGLPVIQDARFALDCALRGARFVYCQGVMAHYRVSDSGSLSRRSPAEFHRDCYRNAVEIEAWWNAHGGVDEKRRRALTQVLGFVARASHGTDNETFEAALADLERLEPGYKPEGPMRLKLASKFLGYRRAERAAAGFRRMKDVLVPKSGAERA